ncbi:MAG: CvpA family protein [Methylovulum sp.]|jgi:membrane protein required for colicin V production|nr:CvpA family protein [Methylovulum sp.]MCF7998594.1 CvpA family protein [Methylovulum sp.]
MIWVDFAICGILSITLLVGVFNGSSRQAYSLICWLLAILIGLSFSPDFAKLLKSSIDEPVVLLAASFASLCIITLTVGGLILLLLGEQIKKSRFTVIERLGGLCLGFVHGIVFVILLVMLAGLSVLPHSPWWKKSKFIPPFQSAVVWLQHHMPSELTKNVNYR